MCVQCVLEEIPCTLSQLEMDHASLIFFSAWKILAWMHCNCEADYWMVASFGWERIRCHLVSSPRAACVDLWTLFGVERQGISELPSFLTAGRLRTAQ